MNGITILSIEQTYTSFETLLLILSACGIFVFGALAFAMLGESLPISCMFVALSVICIIFCILVPKSETLYKTIIEDNVSWNDLSKHYNIIKTDGKIITLVEKEQNDEKSN